LQFEFDWVKDQKDSLKATKGHLRLVSLAKNYTIVVKIIIIIIIIIIKKYLKILFEFFEKNLRKLRKLISIFDVAQAWPH